MFLRWRAAQCFRCGGNEISTSSARSLALQVLLAPRSEGQFSTQLLDRALAASGLRGPERGLCTQLVYGSVRHRGTLDWILRAVSSRQRQQVRRELWELLRLGAYQLLFLDRVPAHAALHETVELAKHAATARAARFVNAVLRNLERAIEKRLVERRELGAAGAEAAGVGRSPEAVEASRRILESPSGRLTIFREPIFPPVTEDAGRNLSIRYAHPAWLIRRWLTRWKPEEVLGILRAGNSPAAVCVRTNVLRVDRQQLLERFQKAGLAAEPGGTDVTIRMPLGAEIASLDAYRDGLFQVQDGWPTEVGLWVAPHPGQRCLDLCAGLGAKATHLAEQIGNRGMVVAADLSREKLNLLRENAGRLGLTRVFRVAMDGRRAGFDLPILFDRVLVDAPCTNTAVLSRRVEVRWRIREGDLPVMAALQGELLLSAADLVRPGGRLVYSTCSLEPEENEQMIRGLLGLRPHFELEKEELRLPELGLGGGYAAALMRRRRPPSPART